MHTIFVLIALVGLVGAVLLYIFRSRAVNASSLMVLAGSVIVILLLGLIAMGALSGEGLKAAVLAVRAFLGR
jgi:membrane-bound metal-dependent hydrolase YbcI (DUF457 family)